MSIKHVNFDTYGAVNAAAITDSFQTVLSLTDDIDVLWVFNSCDQPIILSLPTVLGEVSAFKLIAGASFCFDCRINQKRIAKGAIKIKHDGVAPTSGTFSVGVAR